MAIQRDQPYEESSFVVDLGAGVPENDPRASFREVVLPEARVDDVTYRSGDDRSATPHHEPGLTKYGHLILKRGVVGALDLWEWWKQARDGDRHVDRDISVKLLDEQGQVVWRWRFFAAFPVAYRTSSLDAASSEIVVEELELTFDRMEID